MIQFFNLNEISEKEFTAINNENNTPYQNYGWLKILDEAAHRNPVKRLCVIYKIAVWSIDGEILAIAPVVFSRFGARRKELMCWGYNMSTDYTDFLYSKGINESFVDSLINELLTVSGKERIFFSSVPECSITFKAIENMKATEILCKHTCVHIPLHQPSFDAFFNQLSKSTRQNIRTAYNRLKTDKLCAELAVYENNQIDAELVDLLQRMYEKRREKLNAHKQTVRSKLVKQYRKFSLKKYSFMGEAMLHNPSSLVLVYYIDGMLTSREIISR